LVEVLVASTLMAVALVVLLGSLSSLLIGSRVAERRTVEERIARSQIESLIAQKWSCPLPTALPTPTTTTVDNVPYMTEATCQYVDAGYIELKVTVHRLGDSSDHGTTLRVDRVPK
jgi:Tfp pilus assembly protein PilV